ncbi:MAG: copper-binding protein [Litorimonas sp.]
MTYKLLTLPAALLLVSCGASDAPSTLQEPSSETHVQMDHEGIVGAMPVETKSNPEQPVGDSGTTTGIIRSISENGDFLTIDHAEIEGVGMGAMTMGFEALSNVDLSGFGVEDRVAFSVKRGRDGSYRITAICETSGNDKSCLLQ